MKFNLKYARYPSDKLIMKSILSSFLTKFRKVLLQRHEGTKKGIYSMKWFNLNCPEAIIKNTLHLIIKPLFCCTSGLNFHAIRNKNPPGRTIWMNLYLRKIYQTLFGTYEYAIRKGLLWCNHDEVKITGISFWIEDPLFSFEGYIITPIH